MFVLDRDTCKTCGSPAWLCHSRSNLIEFEIHSGICHADAELQRYKDSPGAPELEDGEYLFAKVVGLKDENGEYEPLPSRRESLELMDTSLRYDPNS